MNKVFKCAQTVGFLTFVFCSFVVLHLNSRQLQKTVQILYIMLFRKGHTANMNPCYTHIVNDVLSNFKPVLAFCRAN